MSILLSKLMSLQRSQLDTSSISIYVYTVIWWLWYIVIHKQNELTEHVVIYVWVKMECLTQVKYYLCCPPWVLSMSILRHEMTVVHNLIYFDDLSIWTSNTMVGAHWLWYLIEAGDWIWCPNGVNHSMYASKVSCFTLYPSLSIKRTQIWAMHKPS